MTAIPSLLSSEAMLLFKNFLQQFNRISLTTDLKHNQLTESELDLSTELDKRERGELVSVMSE